MATGTQMATKDTEEVRDTEITLSTGKLLGMFFALAIVCGVFFTMGYLLGKSTSAGGRTEIVASGPSGSTATKPNAGNKTPETTTQVCPPGSPNCGSSASSPSDTSSAGKTAEQQAAAHPSRNKPADLPSAPAGHDA